MSWQAASFAVLALVLVGGFAWYERSRPPSQVVALVAALAALAVASRLLLAPIPNVVGTTDVALFSGYALGAAPGFAVGALAGLISNFWLGQGPWTPWQMAGWGLAGVFGALLARATGGRGGRLELAAACGVAGVAYGALLNFSLMVSYGGEFTLDRWLTLEARAVPFDLAHAIGNVTLALVAGPALVRMLTRFRERFDFRWRGERGAGRRSAAGTAIAAAVVLLALSAFAAPASAQSPSRWLVRAANADGGFGATPGTASSTQMTGWAMLGLEAAGINPRDVGQRGRSPVAYLRRNVGDVRSPGDLARTILALRGAGVNARSFAGRDLVADLRSRRRANGSYQGWPNSTAFAVMALRAAGATRGVGRSLAWLRRVQGPDGGWGAIPGAGSDPDSTGAVLQALAAGSRATRRGVRYLRRSQRRGGGWALTAGSTPNSQSTAWATQGLLAAGVDAGSVREGGRSGLDFLAARRARDGHYRYSATSDQTPVWVTAQALAAANLKPFPLAPVRRARGDREAASAKGAGSRSDDREVAGDSGPPAVAGVEGGVVAPSERRQHERAPEPGHSEGGPSSEVPVRRGSSTSTAPAPERVEQRRVSETVDDDSDGAPLAAIGVGLAAAALVVAASLLVARRYGG